jgi:hypothetical protein
MKHRVVTITALALIALAIPAATASAADRDHDRMRDSWEKHYKLNTRANDARKDKDHDGLRNVDEFHAGTSPTDADSDDDGVGDDNEGAGTVKSFNPSTGALVIDLFDSTTDLSGKVDSTTEIDCDDENDDENDDDNAPGSHHRDGADDGPGDDHGHGQHGDNEDSDHADDDPAQPGCDASLLTVGRVVKEAKLNEPGDGPAGVFHEIELVR